jgi:hypothetical protein
VYVPGFPYSQFKLYGSSPGSCVVFDQNNSLVPDGCVGASIDPAEYGAVGNGLEDDTSALQSASEAAFAQGRSLSLSGNYLINSQLKIRGHYKCTQGQTSITVGSGFNTLAAYAP